MVILPCLEIFVSGSNYIVYVFLLAFVWGLIYKLLHGSGSG